MINLVKYKNTLPNLPFDLKFINCSFNLEHLAQYKPTSLEQNYLYDLHTNFDIGITVDLINTDKYIPMANTEMHPIDEFLVDEGSVSGAVYGDDGKRSKTHAKNISWFRRSEYISSENTRFKPQCTQNIESKVGANLKKSLLAETLYMNRKSQIKAIQKTFNDSKSEIQKHYRYLI